MNTWKPGRWRLAPALLAPALLAPVAWAAEPAVALPSGVQAVWDLARASRETTPTRERVCVNGLWRWQPTVPTAETVPDAHWGFFKVPGSWPGITDYMQKDCQTVFAHPSWASARLREVTAAWYQREIAVPAEWRGRRIALSVEYLNSYAAVFLDGARVGELRFPAGELDLTDACRPGERQVLSLLVVALPLKGVMLSHTDSASAREVQGTVARRGLCGDVFLASTPARTRLGDVRIETSVRRWELGIDAAIENVPAGTAFTLVASIESAGRLVKAFRSPSFRAEALRGGRFAWQAPWRPERLWDLHTPQHQYALHLELLEAEGDTVDHLPPLPFGFREFWIDGRDFYLNGTRLHLSALPLDNAQVGAAAASYAGARASLERLRTLGINFVYAHNYDCEPGAHLGFAEILRAADDLGMLVALTQPHFSHYDWAAPEADARNGYARHAAFYARVAGNHPSVVAYATSHNATGYSEDMNPDLMDGVQERRDSWALNNVRKALRAEAIVRSLDPGRIVYHHASGNLGPMHLSNFYPNFVPVQELSDWFEPWATRGVKPVFLCEYGAPFTWDWAMYRGWYRGKREFGSAVVPWEFCLAEWNAQFLGDRAFALSEAERRNLRWEARQFEAGKLWHRWDYPHPLGSTDFPEREPVLARYYADNWRAFRTWGVSATSPWEHHVLFRMRPGLARNQREVLPVDWAHLQRPGFSPDYLEERFERMDLAYARTDWVPTLAAQALMRNNQPQLAYLAGKPARFTSQDHLFLAGETVEKQLIVLNNSREPVTAACAWSLDLPQPIAGRTNVTVQTGQQARLPLRFVLPETLAPGDYAVSAQVEFDPGETQTDTFPIRVLSRPRFPRLAAKVAVFDPAGETRALLDRWGVRHDAVDADANLTAYDVLAVGRGALTPRGPAPDFSRVRQGLKVVVFEQTGAVLEQRFGFRVAEYGLRQAFPRVPDHPALAGLTTETLRDWRGAATLLPPRLDYELNPKFNGSPTVKWCGLDVTRAWRCGNQGNVASVLIETPAGGDFLPIVEGGFSLQYSPLMEFREGRGVVLFCQMDVTGRTERDPAAETLAANLFDYLGTWASRPVRAAWYAGEDAGRAHLEAAGFRLGDYTGGALPASGVLVLGPGSGAKLAAHRDALAAFLKADGALLALGLNQAEADALLPFPVELRPAEYIGGFFEAVGLDSRLVGLGPGDVHNRAPRTLPLVAGGARVLGQGVLAEATNAPVVFCQLVPWRFEHRQNYGLKRTFRRSSAAVTRLLANLGAPSQTPLLERAATPVAADEPGRWRTGFYLDAPEEWDDPYRFFRW